MTILIYKLNEATYEVLDNGDIADQVVVIQDQDKMLGNVAIDFIDKRHHQLFQPVIKGGKLVEGRPGLHSKPGEALCQGLDEICCKALWVLV